MRRTLAAAAVILLAACSADGPAAPGTQPGTPLAANPGFLISEAGEPSPALADSALSTAWIALVPGTVPTGIRAELRRPNRTTILSLVDGGFDPIEVPANPGDTLFVTVYATASLVEVLRDQVRPAQAPRVVRTSPRAGQAGLPVDAPLLVVFSEPVDPASLTPGTVRLHGPAGDVAADLTVRPGGYAVELVPRGWLGLGASYTLEVTTAVRDLGGLALRDPLQVTFTAATTAPAALRR